MKKYISEYKKQRKRIQETINRYKRQGVDVQFTLPAIPKRITAGSVRRLSKITPQKIREKSFVPDFETGEQVSADKFFKENKGFKALDIAYQRVMAGFAPTPEKNVQSEKPVIDNAPIENVSRETLSDIDNVPGFEEIIIESFKEIIDGYPDHTRVIVEQWLESSLREYGPSAVANMLEEAMKADMILSAEEAYRTDKIYNNIYKMMSLMDISAAEKNLVLNDIYASADFNEDFIE